MPVRDHSIDCTALQSLWPAALVGTDGADGEQPVVAGYRVVPSAADPRFLLPDDRHAAAAVLRHFRSPGSRAARGRLVALRTIVRVSGGWPAARDRVKVIGSEEQAADSIEGELSRVLGQPVVLGIHLGPLRANRKPILQILDRQHRPLAVAKLGVDPLTSRLVRGEAENLTRLGTRSLGMVRVPTLLHSGTWNGAALLVVEHLPLGRSSRLSAPARVEAMTTVARSGPVSRLRFAEGPAFARMVQRAGELPDGAIRADADGALARLAAVSTPWEHGTWHGDWTVWNCAAHGQEVLVWDWERCEEDVPLGWDALHHELREQLQDRPPTPDAARALVARSPFLLRPFGVADEIAADVARAYLLEVALRYLVDRQLEKGGPVGRVEEWILPVVREA